MNLLITGANGFVGVPLCRQARALPTTQTVYGAVRSEAAAQTLPPRRCRPGLRLFTFKT
jgi:uncharacterized protein YbjT (DUF2867 family)